MSLIRRCRNEVSNGRAKKGETANQRNQRCQSRSVVDQTNTRTLQESPGSKCTLLYSGEMKQLFPLTDQRYGCIIQMRRHCAQAATTSDCRTPVLDAATQVSLCLRGVANVRTHRRKFFVCGKKSKQVRSRFQRQRLYRLRQLASGCQNNGGAKPAFLVNKGVHYKMADV